VTRTQADTGGTFARNLRTAMAARDLTQEALAREAVVSFHTVSAWARGKAEPKGRQLIALATVLDREPAWFFHTGPQEEAA
jgi:transcriptional regulator with XRE-family HTH domain